MYCEGQNNFRNKDVISYQFIVPVLLLSVKKKAVPGPLYFK